MGWKIEDGWVMEEWKVEFGSVGVRLASCGGNLVGWMAGRGWRVIERNFWASGE